MSRKRELTLDTRGASMVFGLFFAVFLVACVSRIQGVIESIWCRQHQQDAADAMTFAGAVMNARGMNLLALINMAMAAVLSVLVGLRLTVTLVDVALVALSLAAAFSFGAASAAIGPLTNVRVQVAQLAEKVATKMPKILSAMHTAGKAVSVVVPLGANARVLQVATGHYDQRVAVGIPGRLALPVEDGDPVDTCMHAGQMAAQIAMLPIQPILPDAVRGAVEDAVAAIVKAGPSWFCNVKGAKKPDIDPGDKYRNVELPVLPYQKQCTELSEQYAKSGMTDAQGEGLNALCRKAAVEYAASVPSRTGEARVNEPLCPTDCAENPRATCPPQDVDACDAERSAELEQMARESGMSTSVAGGFDSAYATRQRLAHEQCDPRKPRKEPLSGFQWLEQTEIKKYAWVKNKLGQGQYQRVDSNLGPPRLITAKEEDSVFPCGPGGIVSEKYEESWIGVCVGDPVCTDASGDPIPSFAGLKGCPQHPLIAGTDNPPPYFESETRVVSILRCVERQERSKLELPDVDVMSEALGDTANGENTAPFQLDSESWLGGSDFQFRGITLGKPASTFGERMVRAFTTGGNEAEPWHEAIRKLARFGFSQAEFYFDLKKFSGYANQTEPSDRVEWLWNQGWVARMRPFRLNHSSADGPRNKARKLDALQAQFAGGNQEPAQDLSACTLDGCQDLMGILP